MKSRKVIKNLLIIIGLCIASILLRVIIRYWMGATEETFGETLLYGLLQAAFLVPVFYLLEYINKTIKK